MSLIVQLLCKFSKWKRIFIQFRGLSVPLCLSPALWWRRQTKGGLKWILVLLLVCFIRKHLTYKRLWRWADSNRRPNTAPGSFLHVYSFFCFRPESAERQASTGLSFKSWRSLKESLRASGLDDTSDSVHNRPKERGDTRRSRSLGGRRLS